MTRPRLTLAQLMAIVFYLGFGFAVLRNADEFWASAAYTLAVVSVPAALVVAVMRKGLARAPSVGFAIFGYTYLLVVHLPDWRIGGLGFGPIYKPPLLFEWATARLQPYVRPLPPRPSGDSLMGYEQVSQSMGIILSGVVGAVVGRVLAIGSPCELAVCRPGLVGQFELRILRIVRPLGEFFLSTTMTREYLAPGREALAKKCHSGSDSG